MARKKKSQEPEAATDVDTKPDAPATEQEPEAATDAYYVGTKCIIMKGIVRLRATEVTPKMHAEGQAGLDYLLERGHLELR